MADKRKADLAMREVLNGRRVRPSEKVKAAVKALRKERQLSDEQLNRRATI